MIAEGVPPEAFIHEERTNPDGTKTPADDTGLKDGALKIDFSDMAVEYFVQCVPGSLVELEDDKQLRQLKEVFVPLSQALPAMAQSGDTEALARASKAMQYIVEKTIELSGSSHSNEIKKILRGEEDPTHVDRVAQLEQVLGGSLSENGEMADQFLEAFRTLLLRSDDLFPGTQGNEVGHAHC